MNSLLPVFSILTIAAITPGPNNLIVMTAASRGGFRAALPSITGVVWGGLFLMLIVWTSAGATFELAPQLRPLLQFAGASYLVWLGVLTIWHANRQGKENGADERITLPDTLIGTALFQLVNPKSWVLVLTVTAAMSEKASGLIILAILMGLVTTSCLALWAWAGSTLAVWLKNENSKRRFDTLMGMLLVGSAGMLFV